MPALLEPAEKIAVHAAMEKHRGHRGLAAKELGLTTEELKFKLRACEELRLAWCTTDEPQQPPTDTDAMSRSPLDIIPVEDQAIAEHFLKENRLLRDGLKRLDLTDHQREIAREWAMFNQKHFFQSIDIMHGSVTRLAIVMHSRVCGVFDRVDEVQELIRRGRSVQGRHRAESPSELKNADENGTVETLYDDLREKLVMEERSLYRTAIEMVGLCMKIAERSSSNTVMLAGVKMMLNGKKSPHQEKRAKPGFTENADEAAPQS